MPAVSIRNLDDAVIEALKRRASANNRSLEGELREILQQAAELATSSGRRRRLRLNTVTVGSSSAHGRREIYGDDER
ncbi:MAG TPA: plasmid stabilization protein [Vicinamibacteria bacterium]|nr:plasmid stabilization protein [Vicinamibacteria bacterium]